MSSHVIQEAVSKIVTQLSRIQEENDSLNTRTNDQYQRDIRVTSENHSNHKITAKRLEIAKKALQYYADRDGRTASFTLEQIREVK